MHSLVRLDRTKNLVHVAGVDLFLTVRDIAKGQEVVKEIHASNPSGQGKIGLLEMHLDSLQSVRHCAEMFLSQSEKLNILILNAGMQNLRCPLSSAAAA